MARHFQYCSMSGHPYATTPFIRHCRPHAERLILQRCLGRNQPVITDPTVATVYEGVNELARRYSPPRRGGEYARGKISQNKNAHPCFIDRGYSGIFPCFLGGLESRLVSSMRKAEMSFLRVYFGSMISSMKPCSAAMYGFSNFCRNSSTFACRFLSRSVSEASSRRYMILPAPSRPITAIS